MEQNSLPLSTTFGIVDDKSDLPCSKQKDVLKCHICWEPPTDPVTASCGHVFCWPCIYQWFLNGPKPCHYPLCRHILRAKLDIIPLYGSGDGGVGPSDGNPTRNVAASNNIIPPRPNNPTGNFAASDNIIPPRSNNPLIRATTSNSGVDYIALHASAWLASSQEFTLHIMPDAVLTANGRLIGELIARVGDLETEIVDLQHRNNEQTTMFRTVYELRRIDLRQIDEDADARAEMCRQIISLQRQLDRLSV